MKSLICSAVKTLPRSCLTAASVNTVREISTALIRPAASWAAVTAGELDGLVSPAPVMMNFSPFLSRIRCNRFGCWSRGIWNGHIDVEFYRELVNVFADKVFLGLD